MKKIEQRYFHVIGWTTQSGDEPRFLFGDLSEKQLKKQFIKPYRTGGKILTQQKILNATDLKAVKIIETPNVKDEALKAVQERSLEQIEAFRRQQNWTAMTSAGYGWDDVDIAYAGNEVTTHYVNSKPGSPGLLNQIIHSHWLRVVGAGLIFLAFFAWFNV
ncbi:hypothetical protein AB4Z34_05315 [Ensifer sp. 2YAB10]|uniref:hypothetical protein n=1 Tax=unclassified Ensifer TaxID=2633371 RepID=UPI003F8F9192